MRITTQRQLRNEFWECHPDLIRIPGKKPNDYPSDTRLAWLDWMNVMKFSGEISTKLAERATL